MYTLYYLPSACSLATQVVLHELKQPVEIINKRSVANFKAINPVDTVPVLIDVKGKERRTYTEGAAVMLHLLETHPNALFPTEGTARAQAIRDIMFANATMHPAYSKLFFIAGTTLDEASKHRAYSAAAESINHLWQVVESRLAHTPFLGGQQVSAADIMLSVYSRWGDSFPVNIHIGHKAQNMIDQIVARPSFKLALENEAAQERAHA